MNQIMLSNEQLKERILDQGPTDEQAEAIFSDDLEFVLRAAPGSGKTWTSCRRFIWRGANWPYSAGGLALLSFTNTAVREFQTATVAVGRRDLLLDPNFAGTFDSFVERFIISPFGHLLTESKKRPKLFQNELPGQRNNKKICVSTSKKNGGTFHIPAWEITPSRNDDGETIYKRERQILDTEGSRNAIYSFLLKGYYTHKQRAFLTYALLKKRKHIARILAKRFPEIIIDEAQDCNMWLFDILDLLRQHGAKITLIGDPDQCIYNFALADSGMMRKFQQEWNIPEKPLSKSFRFNNSIADSVRAIGGNTDLIGRGESLDQHRAYLIIDDTPGFASSIACFQRHLDTCKIPRSKSAILCRGHNQLESLRGKANYPNMKGVSKILAEAASLRDSKKNYDKAYKLVEGVVRLLASEYDIWELVDENPDSREAIEIRLHIWRFLKSTESLSTVTNNGGEWIDNIRRSITDLFRKLGFKVIKNLNSKIKKSPKDQMQIPLFEPQNEFPNLRNETIHQVKGESIDGVLVIGSETYWNKVLNAIKNDNNVEERRLAYVAMTRARNLLLVSLPTKHYKKHGSLWESWGFSESN